MSRCPPIRLRSLTLALASACLLTLASQNVGAETYGGEAALLRPHEKSPVQLLDLSLTMQLPKTTGRWHVEVRYVLKSRGAHDHTLSLQLPERHCDSDKRTCRSPTAGHFHGLQTTLNGAPLTPTEDKTAPVAGQRVWVFKVPVKAKKQVTIVQRYQVERTTDGEGELVQVDVGAENRWHGPIAKTAVRVDLQQRPLTLGYPVAFHLSHYGADIPTEGLMKGAATTHLRFDMRRFRAEAPLLIHLATAADVSPARRCPDLRAVANAVRGKQVEAELKRILVMRDLTELIRCRALYLALYGFPFSEKDKRSQFYGNPVSSASASKTVMTGKRTFMRAGLQLNPTYTADLHPPMHQAYLTGLATEIRRRSKK